MLTEENDIRLQSNYHLLIRGSYLNSPAVTERFLVALLILKTFDDKKSFILEAAQRETSFFLILNVKWNLKPLGNFINCLSLFKTKFV